MTTPEVPGKTLTLPKVIKSTHEKRKILYEGLVELKEAILSNKNLVVRPRK